MQAQLQRQVAHESDIRCASPPYMSLSLYKSPPPSLSVPLCLSIYICTVCNPTTLSLLSLFVVSYACIRDMLSGEVSRLNAESSELRESMLAMNTQVHQIEGLRDRDVYMS